MRDDRVYPRYDRYVGSYGMNYMYHADAKASTMRFLESVSAVYDPETFTLLKHGELTLCQTYAATCRESGMAVNIITFNNDFPTEEINKLLITSGYMKYILEYKQ